MNLSHGLVNKLVYLAILILMLIPLFLLGQPDSGSEGSSGGQLTQMRDDFEISEADLGEINPASATMKLSLLGLRGVGATLLWQKAHDHKVHHEWDRLRAVLNNITLLQPHFDKVWEFQAHNMSYNVSTEFDDYRQRYAWVIGGTEYLTEGVHQNRKAPALIWHTGWYYGHKIGRSDEYQQFRRLFADDDPLHGRLQEEGIDVDGSESLGPNRKPDNWLIGRQWLERGYRLTREGGIPIRRKTPLHFYETGPKWLINYATAIEREGELSDAAQRAWQRATDGWLDYGEQTIPTTAAFTIRLNEVDELRRRLAEKQAEFDELAGGLRETMREERLKELSPEQTAALDTPLEERTDEQRAVVFSLQSIINPSNQDIARRVDSEVKLEAIELVMEIEEIRARLQKVEGYRNQVNYEYWLVRAQAEQTREMVEARRLVYEADELNQDAEVDRAIEKYEEAWERWAEIFEKYPILIFDAASDDLEDSIDRYQAAIDSEDFPEDFPLQKFVEMRESGAYSAEEYDRLLEEQRQQNQMQEEERSVLELDFRQMMEQAKKSNAGGEAGSAEATPKADPEMAAEEEAAEEEAGEEKPAEKEAAEEQAGGEQAGEEEPSGEQAGEEMQAPKPEQEPQPAETSKAEGVAEEAETPAELESPAEPESPPAEEVGAPGEPAEPAVSEGAAESSDLAGSAEPA